MGIDATQNVKMRFRIIRKCDVIISKIENIISAMCFMFMSIFVLIGIVMRFILRIPNQFGEEASRYLMICGIFLGISMGVRKKAHLGIQVFVEKLPAKISKIVKISASLITISSFFIFAYVAYLFVLIQHRFGQTSPAMNIPMYIVYSTILLGLCLSLIRSIMVFCNDYIFREKILSEE
jgi:C4-dicarboxylate transporter DctQ subunit